MSDACLDVRNHAGPSLTTFVMIRDSNRLCWCSCGLSCHDGQHAYRNVVQRQFAAYHLAMRTNESTAVLGSSMGASYYQRVARSREGRVHDGRARGSCRRSVIIAPSCIILPYR
jgi:hypothetical protein